MKIKSKYLYMGCIPVSACRHHPEDQVDCIIEECPGCHRDMWVSKKKRLRRESMPKVVRVYCLLCLARASIKQGLDIEMYDINQEH